MNKTKTTKWKVLGALLAVACLSGKANAFLSGNLNIDVTIGGSKSVTVNGTAAPAASTSTVFTYSAANQMVVSVGTAAVQNTSGIISEAWFLSTNGTSLDAVNGGGQTWNLVSSTAPALPGADAFAVQAVFGSSSTASCPASGATDWNVTASALPLTATPVQYTSTVFADLSLATGGANTPKPDDTVGFAMFASAANGAGNRALCYRAILPVSTTKTDQQIIQIIVTAE